MADEPEKPKDIEFFFEIDKDYRIVAANGVWGGITTRGDIQLDFLVEKQAVPESIRNEITEQGGLGREIARTPPARFVRRMQFGVLLSVAAAEVVANLITSKIEEFKKLKG